MGKTGSMKAYHHLNEGYHPSVQKTGSWGKNLPPPQKKRLKSFAAALESDFIFAFLNLLGLQLFKVHPLCSCRLAELAEAKKNEGNTHYKQKSYDTALRLYTQAIGMTCTIQPPIYGHSESLPLLIW